MQLNVQEAYLTLEVSNFILFVLDGNPKNGYFFLHVFDFLGIFLVLLLELAE